MATNPWNVNDIKEFWFLNCPECAFKTKMEKAFLHHALKNHRLSTAFVLTTPANIENSNFGLAVENSDKKKFSSNHQTTKEEKTLEELMFPDFEEETNEVPAILDEISMQSNEYQSNLSKQKPKKFLITIDNVKKESPDVKESKINKEPVQRCEPFLLKRPLKCSYCTLSFKVEAYLKSHMGREHGLYGEIDKKCLFCDSTYREDENLKNHMNNEHNYDWCQDKIGNSHVAEKMFRFEIECAIISSEPTLKELPEVSTRNENVNETPAVEEMNLDENIDNNLMANKVVEKNEPETNLSKPQTDIQMDNFNETMTEKMCPICDLGFQNEHILRNHMTTVHKRKRKARTSVIMDLYDPYSAEKNVEKTFFVKKCFNCKETFSSKKGNTCRNCRDILLAKRKYTETDIVTSSDKKMCPICDLPFQNDLVLKNHITTDHTRDVHGGEKPVLCSLCKIYYVNSLNLKKHMEEAHFKSSEDVITVKFKKSKK